MSYAIKNLAEAKDVAVEHGFSETQESRFPRTDLGAETIGLAYHVVKPGRRQAFGHRHENAEEIYVVIGGSGRVKLDDEVRNLKPLDALRVAPEVARAFEGGDEGLRLLAFGPRHEGDGEILKDFWPETAS